MDLWMAAFNVFGYCLESVKLSQVGEPEDQHEIMRKTWHQLVKRYFPDYAWARFDLDCYDLFDLKSQKIGTIAISSRDPRLQQDWDVVPGMDGPEIRVR